MTLLLNNSEVQQVLTPQMAMQALRLAYRQLIDGEAVCRPRIDIRIPTATPGRFYQWGSMEGGSTAGYFAIRMKSDVVYEQEYNGVRTNEKFAGVPGRFCGLILLTSIETAEPLALINDGYLQHLRVAADAAIGADLLARPGPVALGMLGSGGMARAHVEALMAVRDIASIKVYSPTAANRRAFAIEMAARFDLPVSAVDDPHDAYRGVDILAACTDSSVPVIRGEWLEPGMHVISVGGQPDAAARARFDLSLCFGQSPAPVGRPELGTSDEYLGYLARPEDPTWSGVRFGRAAPARISGGAQVMLADIVAGRAGGRSDARQITYAERGNIQGAQFHAVAGAAYDAARRRGIGRELPTEWFLQDIRD
ncbi:MAG TPA: hypothetical protein VMV33_00730 [Rhodocyclaceae bacterium]|nr:hypothetical protein [Rhodocyclaceae bacterium]